MGSRSWPSNRRVRPETSDPNRIELLDRPAAAGVTTQLAGGRGRPGPDRADDRRRQRPGSQQPGSPSRRPRPASRRPALTSSAPTPTARGHMGPLKVTVAAARLLRGRSGPREPSGNLAPKGPGGRLGPVPGRGGPRRDGRRRVPPMVVKKVADRRGVPPKPIRGVSILATLTATRCSRACLSNSSRSPNSSCAEGYRRYAQHCISSANGPVRPVVLSRAPKAYCRWPSRSSLASRPPSGETGQKRRSRPATTSSMRDLRSLVSGSDVARDEASRDLVVTLREMLERRIEAHRVAWAEEVTKNLDQGQVVQGPAPVQPSS